MMPQVKKRHFSQAFDKLIYFYLFCLIKRQNLMNRKAIVCSLVLVCHSFRFGFLSRIKMIFKLFFFFIFVLSASLISYKNAFINRSFEVHIEIVPRYFSIEFLTATEQ